MKGKRIAGLGCFLMVLAWIAMPMTEANASSTKMPRVMNIVTHRMGSFSYGVAAGFAKVGSKYLPTEFKAVPTAGPSEWVPMAHDGEVDLVWGNAFDSREAYYGIGAFEGQKSSDMVILLRGGPLVISTLTQRDSGITELSQVKGKRYILYSGGRAFTQLGLGFLANVGLTKKDVNVFMVPGPVAGVKALIEGRADVAGTAALVMGVVAELEAGRGARFLAVDPSPEAVKRFHTEFPVGRPYLVKPGPKVRGVTEPTWFWAYDWYILVNKNLPDDVVYELAKTYYNHDNELWPIHPALKGTKKQTFVVDDASLPYHPGAIKFYREAGAWTADSDKMQAELVAKKK